MTTHAFYQDPTPREIGLCDYTFPDGSYCGKSLLDHITLAERYVVKVDEAAIVLGWITAPSTSNGAGGCHASIYDTTETPPREVCSDGMEPEDATFTRDLRPVVEELNRLAAEKQAPPAETGKCWQCDYCATTIRELQRRLDAMTKRASDYGDAHVAVVRERDALRADNAELEAALTGEREAHRVSVEGENALRCALDYIEGGNCSTVREAELHALAALTSRDLAHNTCPPVLERVMLCAAHADATPAGADDDDGCWQCSYEGAVADMDRYIDSMVQAEAERDALRDAVERARDAMDGVFEIVHEADTAFADELECASNECAAALDALSARDKSAPVATPTPCDLCGIPLVDSDVDNHGRGHCVPACDLCDRPMDNGIEHGLGECVDVCPDCGGTGGEGEDERGDCLTCGGSGGVPFAAQATDAEVKRG